MSFFEGILGMVDKFIDLLKDLIFYVFFFLKKKTKTKENKGVQSNARSSF